MEENKGGESDFALKGLQFTYQKNFKAFICESKDVLAILQHNYPECFQQLIDKHPELKAVSVKMNENEEKEKEGGECQHMVESWKPIDLKKTEDRHCLVKDGCPVDEQAAGKGKPGMISRFSKGIKKIIAKLTPTKLRKRWKLEEEDQNDCRVDTKH